MDKVKFADGTEMDCPFFATIPNMGIAYVALDVPFVEAATIFSNRELLTNMEYCGQTVTGYTHLDWLMVESYGIKAQLSNQKE